MTATIAAPTEAELADQVRALQEELAGLDPAIEEAARAGDEATVARLVTRQRMLPHQLTAKRADVLRAKIATATTTVDELAALMNPARERAQEAQEQAGAARAAAEAAERHRQRTATEAEYAGVNHSQAIQARAALEAQLRALLNPPPAPAAPVARQHGPLKSPIFPGGR